MTYSLALSSDPFHSGSLPHLIGHTACQIGRFVLIFGGKFKKAVKLLTTGTVPSPRYEHAAGAFESSSPKGIHLFVFGGRTSRPPASTPSPLYEICIPESSITLFLSGTTPTSLPAWTALRQSPSSVLWPSDRFGHVFTPISSDYLLLCGGLLGYSESLRLISDAYLFHKTRKMWIKIPPDQSQLICRGYAGSASLFPDQTSVLILGGCYVGDRFNCISCRDAIVVTKSQASPPSVSVQYLSVSHNVPAIMRSPYPQLSLLSISNSNSGSLHLDLCVGSLNLSPNFGELSRELAFRRERHSLSLVHKTDNELVALVVGGRFPSTAAPVIMATVTFSSNSPSSPSITTLPPVIPSSDHSSGPLSPSGTTRRGNPPPSFELC
ncbi:hypothetical protein GEMRC1_006979 [Eukaryota sp. GEM-RC1]